MGDTLSPSLKLFRIIADETRLTLLMILHRAECTVGEMVRILGIHQSNISRHLSQLRDGTLVDDRREGSLVYYRWSEALRGSPEISSMIEQAWRDHPGKDAVEGHVEALLAQRRRQSEDFFDSVAGRYRKLAEPGGGMEPLLRALGTLLNFAHAVDIGSGEGDVALILARGCQKVTTVDFNRRMLEIQAERFKREGYANIEPRQGDMEHLPVEDASADLVVMSQVLHHAPSPERALGEMKRILKPKGRFVLLDLVAHDQDWVRERLGDHWLGFEPNRLREWIEHLDLTIITSEVIHVQEGLPAVLIVGTHN